MKVSRIQYTCKPEFVAQNTANIEAVMKEVRSLNKPDFKYATYLSPDGKSFMHFATGETEDADKFLFELESFKKFRKELNESNPEVPPKTERFSLVGSSFDLF